MDFDKLAALALAFPILAATATPGVARADSAGCYYDPCEFTESWQDLAPINAAKIPSDGVLVLQGNHKGDDAASLPSIDLQVTRDGQPIAGALEATSLHGVLVWRPSEAWEAGATYALAGTVTNPPESADCAPMMVAIEAMLNIDVAPGAALGAVDFTGESEVQNSSNVSLATLACCEGATPYSGYSGCGGSGVYWDPNECAPTQATGYLSVQIEGQPATSGPAAAQILYTLKVDEAFHSISLSPQFSVFTDAPFCAVIEATDLASGAVSQGQKHCFGDAVADMLGPQALDPKATLQCALENCANENGSWDPMMCTPFDPDHPTTSESDDSGDDSSGSGSDTAGEGEGDKGCGCNARSTGDASLLALVGLVGLARRRRRRR
jgi:MYXO-CTERM domain-containing protein